MLAADLQVGSLVSVTGGKYAGRDARVKSFTEKMVEVVFETMEGQDETKARIMQSSVRKKLDSATTSASESSCSHDPKSETLSEPIIDLQSGFPVADPSYEAAPEHVNGALVDKIMLKSAGGREDSCFLKEYFKDRTLLFEASFPRSAKANLAHPGSTFEYHNGRRYELVSLKIIDQGMEVWGGKKKCVRMLYVSEGAHMCIRDELDRVADFSALPDARKVASRLELLQSTTSVDRIFTRSASEFEAIEEPQPTKDSGGCGFISDEMLHDLFGTKLTTKRITSIQVRICGPRLGVVKGMLRRKLGIQKIQLPPSMMKVPPSTVSDDDRVVIVVTRVTPFQKMHLQMSNWLQGKEPAKSWKQHKFSPMMERLLISLEVPRNDLKAYTQAGHDTERSVRKDAYLVGVADPTGGIPDRCVVVTGLPADHIPIVNGVKSVFVTRSPCVKPADGLILPVVTSKPEGVAEKDWTDLIESHFGEIVFPSRGVPLPEEIAAGDLDGDLYWVCWDSAIVQHVRPRPSLVDARQELKQKTQTRNSDRMFVHGIHNSDKKTLGKDWLARAQEHMLDTDVLREGMLIGKLFTAALKKFEESTFGMDDPDVQALFNAYSEAIDMGKHGGGFSLPEHLRKELGISA